MNEKELTSEFYSLINNIISEEAYDMFSEEAYNAWGYLGKFESENGISDLEEKLAFALIRAKVEKYFSLKERNGSLHIVRILE